MKKLRRQIDLLEDQLYDLHFAEPNPEQYEERKSELEYRIAVLEEQIEFEKKLNPMRVGFMIFAIIAAVLAIYLILVK